MIDSHFPMDKLVYGKEKNYTILLGFFDWSNN